MGMVVMVVAFVVVVVVVMVSGLLVMLHHNSPHATQPHALKEALQPGQRDGAVFSISVRFNGTERLNMAHTCESEACSHLCS